MLQQSIPYLLRQGWSSLPDAVRYSSQMPVPNLIQTKTAQILVGYSFMPALPDPLTVADGSTLALVNENQYIDEYCSLTSPDAHLEFQYPLSCSVTKSKDGCAIVFAPFNIHAWGESYNDAIVDFVNEILYLYDYYKEANDEILSGFARSVKYGILYLVREVRRGEP
jgi:hypothetical protein